MLIAALMIYLATLFGGGGAAMEPILAELDRDASDRVHLIADSKSDRKAITDRIDAVLAASESRSHDIKRLSDELRKVSARHDATREELLQAVNALRDATSAELDATVEAYIGLRQSLTGEQWTMLFPTPHSPQDIKPDA